MKQLTLLLCIHFFLPAFGGPSTDDQIRAIDIRHQQTEQLEQNFKHNPTEENFKALPKESQIGLMGRLLLSPTGKRDSSYGKTAQDVVRSAYQQANDEEQVLAKSAALQFELLVNSMTKGNFNFDQFLRTLAQGNPSSIQKILCENIGDRFFPSKDGTIIRFSNETARQATDDLLQLIAKNQNAVGSQCIYARAGEIINLNMTQLINPSQSGELLKVEKRIHPENAKRSSRFSNCTEKQIRESIGSVMTSLRNIRRPDVTALLVIQDSDCAIEGRLLMKSSQEYRFERTPLLGEKTIPPVEFSNLESLIHQVKGKPSTNPQQSSSK